MNNNVNLKFNQIKRYITFLCASFFVYGTLEASVSEVAYDIPNEIKRLNNLSSSELRESLREKESPFFEYLDQTGKNFLMYCAEGNHIGILFNLLVVNRKSGHVGLNQHSQKEGMTPIMYAIEREGRNHCLFEKTIMPTFIQFKNINLNAKDINNKSVLDYVLALDEKIRRNTITILLDYSADSCDDLYQLNLNTKAGKQLILDASESGQEGLVKKLLAYNPKKEEFKLSDKAVQAAFIAALENKKNRIVRLLIKYKQIKYNFSKVNTETGKTFIIHAIESNNQDGISILFKNSDTLKEKIDLNQQADENGKKALIYVIEKGDKGILAVFLKYDPNNYDKKEQINLNSQAGHSALMHMINNKVDLGCLQLFLQYNPKQKTYQIDLNRNNGEVLMKVLQKQDINLLNALLNYSPKGGHYGYRINLQYKINNSEIGEKVLMDLLKLEKDINLKLLEALLKYDPKKNDWNKDSLGLNISNKAVEKAISWVVNENNKLDDSKKKELLKIFFDHRTSIDLSKDLGTKLLNYIIKKQDKIFLKKLLQYSAQQKNKKQQLNLHTDAGHQIFIWMFKEQDQEFLQHCMEYNARHQDEAQFDLNRNNAEVLISLLEKKIGYTATDQYTKNEYRLQCLLKSYSKHNNSYQYHDYKQNPQYELDLSNKEIGPKVLKKALVIDIDNRRSFDKRYSNFVKTFLEYDPQQAIYQLNLSSDEMYSVIQYIIEQHYLAGLKQLLQYKPKHGQYKININAIDKNSGNTLLHVAMEQLQKNPLNGYTQDCCLIIKTLMEYEIDANIVNQEGKVAMQLLTDQQTIQKLYLEISYNYEKGAQALAYSLQKRENEDDNKPLFQKSNNSNEIKMDISSHDSDKEYSDNNSKSILSDNEDEYKVEKNEIVKKYNKNKSFGLRSNSDNNDIVNDDKKTKIEENGNKNEIAKKHNKHKSFRFGSSSGNNDIVNDGKKKMKEDDVEEKNRKVGQKLENAITNNQPLQIKEILANHSSCLDLSQQLKILHYTVDKKYQKVEVLKLLLKKYPELLKKDNLEIKAIQKASWTNNYNLVHTLVLKKENGYDADLLQKAAIYAVNNNHPKALKALLKSPYVDCSVIKGDKNDTSFLKVASYYNYVNVIKVLFKSQKKIDVDYQPIIKEKGIIIGKGKTALMDALFGYAHTNEELQNKFNTVDILLKNNVNPNLLDKDKCGAFTYALNFPSIAKRILKDNKFELRTTYYDNNTVLHLLVKKIEMLKKADEKNNASKINEFKEMLTYVLQKNQVNPNIINNDQNKRAIDITTDQNIKEKLKEAEKKYSGAGNELQGFDNSDDNNNDNKDNLLNDNTNNNKDLGGQSGSIINEQNKKRYHNNNNNNIEIKIEENKYNSDDNNDNINNSELSEYNEYNNNNNQALPGELGSIINSGEFSEYKDKNNRILSIENLKKGVFVTLFVALGGTALYLFKKKTDEPVVVS